MRNTVLLIALLVLPGRSWSKPAKSSAPALFAAAGKTEITPRLGWRPVWLAGYGAKGRRAKEVHDPLYARALVLSDGTKTVALVSVDALGLYREDVNDIRRQLGWEGPDRWVFVAATHGHAAPDSLGLWGRWPGFSGVDPRRHRRLKKKVVGLVRELSGRLQEAELRASSTRLDPGGLCRDSRDPAVLDPELNVLSLLTRDGKRSIGTLVRWSCHAEVLGPDNRKVSADFPGALCSRVEEKTGGGCVFMPGLIGGLQTPDVQRGGPAKDFEAMAALGGKVADAALKGLEKADRWASAPVDFSSKTVRLPVDNSIYLAFLHSLRFGHRLYDARGRRVGPLSAGLLSLRHLVFFPLPERLRPLIETEVSLVRLGPVRILGVPGELFPELALGGYGGELRFGAPLTGPANPNPPRLEEAPKGPYLRELMKARHGLIVGPANDMIGYIVPEYDFQVRDTRTMHPRPKGTHYEETNSTGRRTAPLLLEACRGLLGGPDFIE